MQATATTAPDPTVRSASPPGLPPTSAASRPVPRLLRLAPWVAGAMSVVYLALGGWWWAGGGGWPWDDDPEDGFAISLASSVSRSTAAAAVTAGAALALLLVAAGVLITRSGRGRRLLTPVAGVTAGLGVIAAVVVPDFRLLAGIGYAPMAIVWVLTSTGHADEVAAAHGWPWQNQALLCLLGVALLTTAVALRRAAGLACAVCGRAEREAHWRAPHATLRWARLAVGVAVAVPLGYAVTRYAWFLGYPLGLSDTTFEKVRDAAPVGAGLATFGVLGAALTLGLVRSWGEVVPRWVPLLGGRRVPVPAAVVPASAVSVVVASAGVMFVRMLFSGSGRSNLPVELTWADAAGWLPEVFWPLWAVALALATYAYWLRRRGSCTRCGRG